MKYSRIAITLFVIILSLHGKLVAQTFEGALTYKVDVIVLPNMQQMGVTKEALVDKMKQSGSFADTQKVYYSKDGSYRIEMKSAQKTWSIYLNDSNKIYSFSDNSTMCTVKDASVDLESTMTGIKPAIKLLDTTVTVNDKPCKVVRVQWNTGYYDYAFSDNFLQVNPDLYKNHIYDGWADYLKIANALPVQITKVTNGMMKITYTLTEVKNGDLETGLFVLPALANYTIIKM